MNRVCLVGRLARDPQCEYVNTSNGSTARTRFTVAVDRRSRDENRQADFISCVAWNKQAENLAKFQKKGNQVSVEGRIQVDNYTDKNGNTVWNTYVVADTVQYLDRKGDAPVNTNFDNDIGPKDVSPSDFSSDTSPKGDGGASVWDAGSNIEIDPDELPFY